MVLKWSSQRVIAHSKIVKSSIIWLIVVPFAAKALSALDDVVELTIFNGSFTFSTVLPFSWQLLFFSACFFTVAGLIYSLFCPEIVKLYQNYTQFEADGKSRLQINTALKEIVWDTSHDKLFSEYVPIASKYFKEYSQYDFNFCIGQDDNGLSLFDDVDKNKGKNSNAFYWVYQASDIYMQAAIRSSLLLYSCGFICVAIIALQNILYVIDTI